MQTQNEYSISTSSPVSANRHQINLTPAQQSAIECRDVYDPIDEEEALLGKCFHGRYLSFDMRDQELLWKVLNDASNAEDDQAQDANVDSEIRRFSRSAALALANIASKVLKTVVRSNGHRVFVGHAVANAVHKEGMKCKTTLLILLLLRA